MLGQQERELQKGMRTEIESLNKQLQASERTQKSKWQLMDEWATETRKNARHAREIGDEGTRRPNAFVRELRAETRKPLPTGNSEEVRAAMQERRQAIARIRQKWMPRIRENEEAANAANRTLEREDRRYQQKVDSADTKQAIRTLRNRYRAAAQRVRKKWSPRIRSVARLQEALQEELHRRCPHGAALSPHRQQCLK